MLEKYTYRLLRPFGRCLLLSGCYRPFEKIPNSIDLVGKLIDNRSGEVWGNPQIKVETH